jgi:hypothetical protein
VTPKIIGKVNVSEDVGFSQKDDLSSAEQEVDDAADVLVVSLRTNIRLGGGIGRPVICSSTSMTGGLLIFMVGVCCSSRVM